MRFSIDRLIVILDWLASLYDMHVIIPYLCINLVSYNSSRFAIKVCFVLDYAYLFICYHACLAFTLSITVWYPQLINLFSHLFHFISRDLFLGT